MPKGFEGVRTAAAEINAKQSNGPSDRVTYLKLKDGESATVRFLEQGDEICWAWCHEMPPRGRQRWGDMTPCLDQSGGGVCPACRAGVDRTFNGWINLIWHDGPIYKRNEDGSTDWNTVVERKPIIAQWERGIMTFQELDGKDSTYKGLRSRKFKISRKGSGMSNTKYIIEPEDVDSGPQELSDVEKELIANKPDLTEKITPISEEKMLEWLNIGGGSTGDEGGVSAVSDNNVNPFL